ncbi:MAG: DUF3106 domain-containing protein [Proteobacteria bacterium]|nr:DUF3106 domain-containing protein [Pseudomonadota bacterium]MBU1688177.1 DUF3106 domain-containing protein [Pseudomonadota bacterium]
MNNTVRLLILILFCVGIAQRVQPADPVTWQGLNSEEQGILRPYSGKWVYLSKKEQNKLLKSARIWMQLDPDQRNLVRQRNKQWRNIPTNQREQTIRQYRSFQELSAPEQLELKSTAGWFANLPPEQQQALLNRWKNPPPR